MSKFGQSSGQGYAFGGAKAKAIKARLRAMKAEQERTGRVSMFDVVKVSAIAQDLRCGQRSTNKGFRARF